MPLDGHTYLTSYGWSGKGTGLRRGAIDKPLAIPQKRNLSGIGKDRDEAFPFWDHSHKAITIKIVDDDDDAEDEDNVEDTSTLQLKRTATGIISNRRPVLGTPASGTSTPNSDAYPRASVIAIAKREAARKCLYSRFFRGPILAPHDTSNLTSPVTLSPTHSADHTPEPQNVPRIDVLSTKTSTSSQLLETREERRERKRLKRERREKKSAKKAAKMANQQTSLHNLGSKDNHKSRKEVKRARKAMKKEPLNNAELQKPDPEDGVFASLDQSRQHEGIAPLRFDISNDIETKKREKKKKKNS